MKRFLLIFALPFLILFFDLSAVVMACSGCVGCTWMDIENDLGEDTIVVNGWGSVDSGSAIVYVSEYLLGEPDYPYLRVYYSGVGQNNAALMGYYTGSCGSGAKAPYAEEAYHVMTRHQDGTYRINHVIAFPSEYPQFVDTSNNGEHYYSLSEEEFLERIQANPQPPLYMDVEFPPVPLASPHLIHTDNKSLYLLPVDVHTAEDIVLIAENVQKLETIDTFIGMTTDEQIILYETLSGFQWTWDHPSDVNCMIVDCIQFSDNGVVMARQVDADTVQICELALIYPNSHYTSEPSVDAHPCIRDNPIAFYDGIAVSFSTDSDYMAIWYDNQITIYGGLSWLNNLMWEEDQIIVTSTTFDAPIDQNSVAWLAARGVWSQDSRWLAYSDVHGLWLWDIFTQEPQLFLATEAGMPIPYARFFSDSGRYMAVSIGDEHFIIDRLSDLTFPDGIIRPDDRALIRRDTVNQMPVPAEICSLLNGECSPLIESDEGISYISNAYWIASHYRPDEWKPCYTVINSSDNFQFLGSCWDVQQTGDFSISFYNNMSVTIDAEGVLDSPIHTLISSSR